ncbi:MAG: stage III sporulation protein AD [Clostridiales bacterium]|nr:stage III sporulation protein AD [Clostridiales bacterium]
MEVLKISAIALVGVLAALQFKQIKPEYSAYIAFAAGLLIFGYACRIFYVLSGEVGQFQQLFGEEQKYFSILFKVIGITYLCEFCSGICKDAGYGGIAGQIEIFGKLAVLFCGMPVLLAVIEAIRTFGTW